MASLNKVILIGNLGKDPEIRYTQSGEPIANFSLATSERWTDKSGQKQERTEWHRVEVFGKTAQIVRDYCTKGKQVYIEGSIKYDEWTDKDGNKRNMTKIRVSGPGSRLVLLGSRGEGGRRGGCGGRGPRAAGPRRRAATTSRPRTTTFRSSARPGLEPSPDGHPALPGALRRSLPLRAGRSDELGARLARGRRAPPASLAAAVRSTPPRASRRGRASCPIEEVFHPEDFETQNDRFTEIAKQAGIDVSRRALASAGLAPAEIDFIVSVSCTGFMIPAVDAYVADALGMGPRLGRLPITESGCAGGVVGLARARDYLAAHPDRAVLLLALEFSSLTFQRWDRSATNVVSTAIFGDGGAAAVLVGTAAPPRRDRPPVPRHGRREPLLPGHHPPHGLPAPQRRPADHPRQGPRSLRAPRGRQAPSRISSRRAVFAARTSIVGSCTRGAGASSR